MKHLLSILSLLGIGIATFSLSSCDPDPCKKDPTSCECENNIATCACNAALCDTYNFTLSATTDTVSGSETDFEIVTDVTFTNTSSPTTDVPMKWKVLSDNLPFGWTRAVCDNVSCWPPAKSSNDITVANAASFPFYVHFYPNNNSGSGTTQVLIWSPDDSVGSAKTVTFHGIAAH